MVKTLVCGREGGRFGFLLCDMLKSWHITYYNEFFLKTNGISNIGLATKSKHGWGTTNDCFIKYLMGLSFEHVIEILLHIHIEIYFFFIDTYIIKVLFYA
jgi:hypothetical protein